MAKDDTLGAIVGILLGLVGIALLAELFRPKCPNCQNPLEQRSHVLSAVWMD